MNIEQMTNAEINARLTPMLRMSDEQLDAMIYAGLRMTARGKNPKSREYRRDECQYGTYSDDWGREIHD